MWDGIRHDAAFSIQRAFRGYQGRLRWSLHKRHKEKQEAAATRIQAFARGASDRAMAKEHKSSYSKAAILIQTAARSFLSRAAVEHKALENYLLSRSTPRGDKAKRAQNTMEKVSAVKKAAVMEALERAAAARGITQLPRRSEIERTELLTGKAAREQAQREGLHDVIVDLTAQVKTLEYKLTEMNGHLENSHIKIAKSELHAQDLAEQHAAQLEELNAQIKAAQEEAAAAVAAAQSPQPVPEDGEEITTTDGVEQQQQQQQQQQQPPAISRETSLGAGYDEDELPKEGTHMWHETRGHCVVISIMPDGRVAVRYDNGDLHRYRPDSLKKFSREAGGRRNSRESILSTATGAVASEPAQEPEITEEQPLPPVGRPP